MSFLNDNIIKASPTFHELMIGKLSPFIKGVSKDDAHSLIVNIDDLRNYGDQQLYILARSLCLKDYIHKTPQEMRCAIQALYFNSLEEYELDRWINPLDAVKNRDYCNRITVLGHTPIESPGELLSCITFSNGCVDGLMITPNVVSYYRQGCRHGYTWEYLGKQLLYKAKFCYDSLLSISYINESMSNHKAIRRLCEEEALMLQEISDDPSRERTFGNQYEMQCNSANLQISTQMMPPKPQLVRSTPLG
jgi:hypothetical protein